MTSYSEGGFAPLPNLPRELDCAGGAGARSATSLARACVLWRIKGHQHPLQRDDLLLVGGLRPPSQPPPRTRLRRRSRRSERNLPCSSLCPLENQRPSASSPA